MAYRDAIAYKYHLLRNTVEAAPGQRRDETRQDETKRNETRRDQADAANTGKEEERGDSRGKKCASADLHS